MSLRPELLDSADLPVAFGRFELVGVLGTGGMGRVFQARLRGPGLFSKDLALKVIHCAAADGMPELREGLQREARLGARLRHPNLVDIYDCGEDEGQPWLAMELIEGGSIQERLADGPLDPSVALALASQTAAGLAYMHELVIDGARSPIVHRDLKPANVMLHFENAKIADYGLARAVHGTSQETWSDAIAGTPAYMAPEQVRGLPLDGRSDLFALGAMLFEMLTGTRFLRGGTLIELVYEIVHVDAHRERLLPLDRIVPGVSGVLRRCLCADVEERWPSARALRGALLALRPGSSDPRALIDALTLESPPVAARSVDQVDVANALTSVGSSQGPMAPESGVVDRSAAERAAEDRRARDCAALGTDVERERLDRRGGGAILAERVARLDELLEASRRMREREGSEPRAWGVQSLLGAAVACERSGRATELIEEATAWLAGPELPIPLVLRLRLARAGGLSRLGRATEAIEDLEWVLERVQGDTRAESEACGLLGYLLIGRDAGRARLLSERALLVDARDADRHRAARSLASLALVDRMQGALSRATERFAEARQVLEETADARLVVSVLVNGWPVLDEIGRRDEATRWAERAIELVAQVEDPLMRAVVYGNRAVMAGRTGRLREAFDGVSMAAGLVAGQREKALRFKGGAAYWAAHLGDAAHGEAVGREMPDAWRAVGDLRSAAVAEVALCEIRRLAGHVHGAAPMLRGAIDTLDRFGDTRAAADGATELAELALVLGLPERAALADDAMLRARRASIYSTLGALFARARARAADGRVVEAEDDARLGRGLARRAGYLLFAARFDALSGRWAQARGEAAEAARLQARAVATAADLDLPRSSPVAREILGGRP